MRLIPYVATYRNERQNDYSIAWGLHKRLQERVILVARTDGGVDIRTVSHLGPPRVIEGDRRWYVEAHLNPRRRGRHGVDECHTCGAEAPCAYGIHPGGWIANICQDCERKQLKAGSILMLQHHYQD